MTGRYNGFQIHHLFPTEILTGTFQEATDAKNFLASIGFALESRGNKIPLLTDAQTRDVLVGDASTLQVLNDAGFGKNTHFGSHPGYNDFIINTLAGFNVQATANSWDADAKKDAVFDLHRFIESVAQDGVPPVNGSNEASFVSAWDAYKLDLHGTVTPDYASLSTSAQNAIDVYEGGFDANTATNKVIRYEVTNELMDGAENLVTTDQYNHADARFSQAGSDGSNSGHAGSASISILVAMRDSVGNPDTRIGAFAENMAAGIYGAAANFIGDESGTGQSADALIADLTQKFETLLNKISQHADAFAANFNDFGDTLIGEMAKSSNQLLVGLGGSVVGDAVEFLNAAYEPLKTGFQTGDWSDFGDVVVQYGAGAAISALIVTGSIVATTAIVGAVSATAAPIVGAFVAAGWAAYGLYDAITNGSELLDKITTDLAEVVADINDALEAGLDKIEDAVRLIFGENRSPDDIDPHGFAYVVDAADLTLPDAIQGSDDSELFFARNGADIFAGDGVDEVHASGHASINGEDGDDFLRGADATLFVQPDGSESRLILNGGAGDDMIGLIGGQGGIAEGDAGNDLLVARGGAGHLLDGGSGDDTFIAIDSVGTVIETGAGADTVWWSSNAGVTDLSMDDRVKLMGVVSLYGGSRSVTSESEWTPGLGGVVQYGLNDDGELVINLPWLSEGYQDMLILNWEDSKIDEFTGGINDASNDNNPSCKRIINTTMEIAA